MISILAKRFITDSQNINAPSVRRAYGILCGTVGVLLNILLFAIKFFAGILSNSIAITADAFNNLSDAGSSVITLFGFKLAGQKPDPEHPFGHGRIEYVSGLIVSLIILLMGFELGKSSVEKIFNPDPITFSWVSFGILIVSILIKMYMAVYNKKYGKRIQSAAMIATATDSLSDCLSTGMVILCNVFALFTDFPLDGWAGLIVAVLILIAGYNAAKETINPLLGQPPAKELVEEIEQTVLSHPDVIGIHDMIIHDYGPGRCFVSLHAEVSADGDILALHDSIDNIERTLAESLGCLTSIHMDPVITSDEHITKAKEAVLTLLSQYDASLTMHDFRMVAGPTHTNLIFDIVLPHNYPKTDYQVQCDMQDAIRNMEGNYYAVIQIDHSFIG